jgi:hypothetical protein
MLWIINNGNNNTNKKTQTHWYGAFFILILGFQIYLSLRNVYYVFAALLGMQALGWLFYYAVYTTTCDRLELGFALQSMCYSLLLVIMGSVLPAVCAWVFDITTFGVISALFWSMELVFYFIVVNLLQSPMYYLLFVPNLMWFFLFLGNFVFDETKTTVFYVLVWVWHYVFILIAEYAIRDPWITIMIYLFCAVVLLVIYGSYISNNHHNFSFYIT